MPDSDSETIIFVLTTISVMMLLTGFIIRTIFLHQKKQFSFQKKMEEVKHSHEMNVMQMQIEIQEQTFEQVSRDIHDHISHSLTLSKLYLNTLKEPQTENNRQRIELAVNLIGEAIRNLSDISRSLSSELIRNFGLIKALENEIEMMNNLGLFKIHWTIRGHPLYLEFKKELTIFRIIQEAFNNIVKHSKADSITLTIIYLDAGCTIMIEDNGVGFDINDTGDRTELHGSGLNNIRQRVQLLNGQYEITTMANAGTSLNIFIPVTSCEPKNNSNHEH